VLGLCSYVELGTNCAALIDTVAEQLDSRTASRDARMWPSVVRRNPGWSSRRVWAVGAVEPASEIMVVVADTRWSDQKSLAQTSTGIA